MLDSDILYQLGEWLKSLWSWGLQSEANLLALIAAVIGIVTGIATLRTASITKSMFENEHRPYIEVQLRDTKITNKIDVFLKNRGNAPAHITSRLIEIGVDVDRLNQLSEGKKLDKLNTIKTKIKDTLTIFPNQDENTWVSFEVSLWKNTEAVEKQFFEYQIHLSYKGISNKKYYYKSVHKQGGVGSKFYSLFWSSHRKINWYSYRKLKKDTKKRIAKNA